MPKTIRSIIVGMGGISRSMLRVLAEKDWHEIAAVVDVREDRRCSKPAPTCPCPIQRYSPTSTAPSLRPPPLLTWR